MITDKLFKSIYMISRYESREETSRSNSVRHCNIIKLCKHLLHFNHHINIRMSKFTKLSVSIISFRSLNLKKNSISSLTSNTKFNTISFSKFLTNLRFIDTFNQLSIIVCFFSTKIRKILLRIIIYIFKIKFKSTFNNLGRH